MGWSSETVKGESNSSGEREQAGVVVASVARQLGVHRVAHLREQRVGQRRLLEGRGVKRRLLRAGRALGAASGVRLHSSEEIWAVGRGSGLGDGHRGLGGAELTGFMA